MVSERVRTMLVCCDYTSQLAYFDDWFDAFGESHHFSCEPVNIATRSGRARLQRGVSEFELVVLLHSAFGDLLSPLRKCLAALADRQGKLLAFVGNEVNMPEPLLSDKIEMLKRIEPDWIGTQLPIDAGKYLYNGRVTSRVVALPHALNPKVFKPDTPIADRPIDIGVRSNKYVAYLGDNDRERLFAYFRDTDFDPALVIDVRTDERFDRAGWAAFLNRCKATIATEAGSYYLQPDDRTVLAIRAYLRNTRSMRTLRQNSPLFKLSALIPPQIKAVLRGAENKGLIHVEQRLDAGLDFEDIYARFFAEQPKAPVYSKAISSRHFDAIGTKTCQLMFRGRFNDILEADLHYLAIQPDFANIDDALARFRDPEERTSVADRAFDHAMAGHTYAHRMDAVRSLLA